MRRKKRQKRKGICCGNGRLIIKSPGSVAPAIHYLVRSNKSTLIQQTVPNDVAFPQRGPKEGDTHVFKGICWSNIT